MFARDFVVYTIVLRIHLRICALGLQTGSVQRLLLRARILNILVPCGQAARRNLQPLFEVMESFARLEDSSVRDRPLPLALVAGDPIVMDSRQFAHIERTRLSSLVVVVAINKGRRVERVRPEAKKLRLALA